MKTDLLSFYIRNFKPFAIGVGLIFVAVFMYFEVISPEFDNIHSKQAEIDKKNQTISQLKDSIQTIHSLNSEDIDSSLNVVNAALPNGKDIIAIYNAMLAAATISDVSIREFSLKVGNVYLGSINVPQNAVAGANSGTSVGASGSSDNVQVEMTIDAPDPRNYFQFSKVIYKSYPLAELSNMNIIGQTGKFNVNFFYKRSDSAAIAQQINVPPLTASQKALSAKLQSWQAELIAEATPSATVTPSPTPSPAPTKKTQH